MSSYIITSYRPLIDALPLDLALQLTAEDMQGEIKLSTERKQLNRVKNALDPVTKIKDAGDKGIARLKGAGDAVFRNPKRSSILFSASGYIQS